MSNKTGNEIALEIDGARVVFVRKDSIQEATKLLGPEVIIRTLNAGVHIGVIESRNGREIVLANARRLWYWEGAFTLDEVATRGVDRKKSRISCATPKIEVVYEEIIHIVEGVDLTPTEGK